MKQLLFLILSSVICNLSSAQVGIGTNTPNSKAILDVQSTAKGVLFPRLTTVQRNAITSPPNGLHIFNTDEHCLNYFDSVYQVWNCYCQGCETVIINIAANVCKLDFYNAYGKSSPASKYIVNIAAGVIVGGCSPGDTAISFNAMPFNAAVTINNRGTIEGAGGMGGNGNIEQGCAQFSLAFATPGAIGGHAISTRAGVSIKINNYGIVAGGGGGGGGSGANPNGIGGGGGGGAGIVAGTGGIGGGTYKSAPIIGGCIPVQGIAATGSTGDATNGGPGGAGVEGGASGGKGGNRGQPGNDGSGNRAAVGGQAGKAIGGGSGNSITSISGGQSFGVVD